METIYHKSWSHADWHEENKISVDECTTCSELGHIASENELVNLGVCEFE